MKKYLIIPMLCLFPSLLFASSLTPPPTDLSVSFLANIFGVVDGVLHGTGSQILGTMFGVFNSTVLVMASVVLSYVLFISILNTSHEGEFLGRKWSSIWVPLRTVSGVGLLIPKATGYSFVQILVMWVVVQGVGAADKVWNVALDYMHRDGTIIEPLESLHSSNNASDNSFLIGNAGAILKSEVCMLTVHNALVNQYRGTGVQVPDFLSTIAVTGVNSAGKTGKPINYKSDTGGIIQFPGKLSGAFANLEGMCGNVSWNFIKKDNAEVDNPANLTANDSASIAARQMTLDLQPLAQNIANHLAPAISQEKTSVPIYNLSLMDLAIGRLVNTADDYFTIVKPALRSLHENALDSYKKFIGEAKDNGWILAGSYYFRMANLNQQLRKTSESNLKDNVKLQTTSPTESDFKVGGFQMIKDGNVITNLINNLDQTKGVIFNSYIKNETNNTANNQPINADPSLPTNIHGTYTGKWNLLKDFFDAVFPDIGNFEKNFAQGMNKDQKDPIFALASVGDDLIHMVETIWMALIGILTGAGALGVAAGLASGFWTVGAAVNGMLMIGQLLFLFVPMFSVWMGTNFVLGSMLSYYVPLIPFFLFAFGAVTWFAVVLEAILAAPLVALGITHPEGHDLMGKAEQSIMLLSSVFLRPVLMVFGFIFGIILSYVALTLFNKGFGIATGFLTNYNGDFLGIVYETAMVGIYATAVIAIVNRSFAMIYEVPNKVLRWIGGPHENGHEESMLQGIRGQHERESGAIGQSLPGLKIIPEETGNVFAGANKLREARAKNKASTEVEGPK